MNHKTEILMIIKEFHEKQFKAACVNARASLTCFGWVLSR